jgi:hypothetical protein
LNYATERKEERKEKKKANCVETFVAVVLWPGRGSPGRKFGWGNFHS